MLSYLYQRGICLSLQSYYDLHSMPILYQWILTIIKNFAKFKENNEIGLILKYPNLNVAKLARNPFNLKNLDIVFRILLTK